MSESKTIAVDDSRPLTVYRLADGRTAVSKQDHLRFIRGLGEIAAACGPKANRAMAKAMEGGRPIGGGFEGAKKHFGASLEAMLALSAPVVTAIDGMLFGFKTWLDVSRFGDDRFMIEALVEIADHLAKFSKPASARSRPAALGPPKFH